ncbi:maleylacetoacetate isomerase [Silvimonas iriomotensis]|uniref:Maleylacetoacetate isomerase n=1 Tax=Silvimonas iriomotensis TaxID=449662 RepID=A0ABQ2P6B4_9NEIS|nr:maleylacetoacetate isomerase [Silvimonas iriomotensis]GGP19054.1 maleylacetoacetate isomerase [Silvimonas iriomotensis]
MADELVLYSYFRSSAAYRVRIALHLKNMPYRIEPVHLLRNGGEQRASHYLAVNPEGLVPTLHHGAVTLTQSLAIIEYLEELVPTPPLLPAAPADRAWVRALALAVACDIHPVNNLRVLQYLQAELGATDAAKQAWYQHWVQLGLAAFEAHLAQRPASRFCFGDTPTLADCCLIPQLFNARRFGCDLTRLPRILAIEAQCQALPAFVAAAPEQQPDAA